MKKTEVKIIDDLFLFLRDFYNKLDQNNRTDYKEVRKLFFRGHSNYEYKLLPGIYRDNHLENEHNFYNDLLVDFPAEFENTKSHFDVLRKMQHYNLPTRLLDITSSILAGIYFAIDSPDKDGELIVFDDSNNEVKTTYSDTVQILSTLAVQDLEIKKRVT